MMGESVYIETIKNCHKWNSKNVTSRVNANSFDQQTGIEQKPTDGLHRSHLERCTPANPIQVYAYPAKRYKRSKEFMSEACEFNYFRSTYPEINAVITSITNPPIEYSNMEGMEQSSMPLRSTNNANKTNGYDDFDDSMDFFDEDFEDDHEEEWGSRRKRKKNGRDNRSNRRSAATTVSNIVPTPVVVREPQIHLPSSSSSSDRSFVCQQCGAKYKSRPGLSYHRLHVHKDESIGQEFAKSPAASLNILASTDDSIDISTTCDLCQGGKELNMKTKQPEQLVNCHDCGRAAHPSCVGFTSNMIVMTRKYGWQCIECKSCTICGTSDNDDALLFCDDCDRGFHLYCLKPPLQSPPEGNWSCQLCLKEFRAMR